MKGNFKTIVILPKYVDIMEWVAVNSKYVHTRTKESLLSLPCTVYDFYTNLNEFYGVIAEQCTQHTCPTMSAGSRSVVLPSNILINMLNHRVA